MRMYISAKINTFLIEKNREIKISKNILVRKAVRNDFSFHCNRNCVFCFLGNYFLPQTVPKLFEL